MAILNMTRPVDARRKKYVFAHAQKRKPEVAPALRPLPKPLGLGDVRSMALHEGGFIVAEWFGAFILCELRQGVQFETEIRSRDVAHLFGWIDLGDMSSAKFYKPEDAHERLGEYGRRLLARLSSGGNAAGNDRHVARGKRGSLVG